MVLVLLTLCWVAGLLYGRLLQAPLWLAGVKL